MSPRSTLHDVHRQPEPVPDAEDVIGKRVTRTLLRQEVENTRLADPEEYERALRRSDVDV